MQIGEWLKCIAGAVMVKKGVWLENLTGKGEDEKYLLRENEEKALTFPSVHCKVLFVTKQFNKNTFSYSEQWRYKGSEKLRQPLNRKVPT